ncbi:MAG: tyrosine-type recombinase/integrase [Fibrobacter sp.]|nr:tyrosine-type recombinase/integrase [Fibrobacter sp.]
MMKIECFLDYLKLERNYSRLTVLKYESCLRLFEEYFKNLNTELEWESVDADVIRDWMESMMDSGLTAATVNGRLSAVRSFYRFALKKGLVENDPAHTITGPKKEKPLPKFIREKDMDRLLQPEMWGDTYKDICARTIILLFYETGMRVGELVMLDDEMVDLDNRQLKVTGKRNKQRIIPFGAELEQALRDFVRLRDEQVERTEKGFFVTEKGQRVTYEQVRRMVKNHLGRVTTQQKRTPHVLRHTFATTMLNHEAGLESVKQLLGHESLATTEIYTHTTFEQLKKVYEKAHPRS